MSELSIYILNIIGYELVAYNIFSVAKYTKKQIMEICMISIISILVAFFSPPIAGIILVGGNCLIMTRNGSKWKVAIAVNVMIVIFLIISEQIFYTIPLFLFNFDLDIFIGIGATWERTVAVLYLNLAYFITSYGIKILIIKRRNWLSVMNNSRFQIIGLSFGLGLYVMFYYVTFYADLGKEYTWMITGLFTVAFITFIVILFLMHNASVHAEKATRKEMELIQLATYTESLEYIYTDMRKVRHDFTNVLSSMVGFLDSRDMDGLIAYFSRDVVSFSSQVNQINLNLGLLGNIEQSEIKGLLALKVLKAEELGVEVKLDITERMIFKDVKTLDLCRVIGILMDNAIEAAIASETPSISVGLLNKSHGQIIVINNSHNEEIASIAKLFEKGYSTKGEGRGFGLSNIREIVNRYQKWSLDTEFSDVMFTQVIELER